MVWCCQTKIDNLNYFNMEDSVKDYLSRLKRVSTKAFEEHTSPKIIHERAKRGVYKLIEIDGMKFIVEPEKDK